MCGCVGLKPTYGRVSRYGLVAFASSLDQIGPFTKDVRDAATLLGVMSGHDPRDSTSVPQPVPDYAAALTGDIKGLKLGLPKEYMIGGLDPEVKAAVDAAVKKLDRTRRGNRGNFPAPHGLRGGDVLHHRHGRSVGESRAFRRHPLWRAGGRRGSD